MQSIFSVDVEDWFHILDVKTTPKLEEWDSLPSRVENNFMKMLEILSDAEVKATCFFLGWVAKKYPKLVKQTKDEGHEIASHGYSHELVYKIGKKKFIEDAVKSKKIIEDISGEKVIGYRCSGFSVTEETPWFFEGLIEAGYSYDSSVFPASREHGGLKTNQKAPYKISVNNTTIIEFPITVTELLGKSMCFFGGGYLRFFPYFFIKMMSNKVLSEGRPVIFYVHPREIDPQHPRLKMNFIRKFKSYVNLKSTTPKIKSIIKDFDVTCFRDYIEKNEI